MTKTASILWHYTDCGGFYGILSSGKIRLGDARFLNDRTERTHGRDVIVDVVNRELADSEISELFLLRVLKELLSPPDTNLFICSFSERYRSMSQWERYAAGGVGYCLGFDRRALERALAKKDCELCQLIYSSKDQKTAARQRLVELAREFKMFEGMRKSPTATQYTAYATAVAVELEELSLRLKNPDFRDEKEWRIIHQIRGKGRVSQAAATHFTPRNNLVKPYVELTLEERGGAPVLPLVKIICGPKLEGDVAIASATYFAAQKGYANVSVEHSKLSAVWR